ncbi:hypothetical protein DSM104299_01776 [Baekduia alba]|uniref:hypothetical protein n=1 Tax=Baekduia alba TaxID=2997333 RepID=UPI0023415D8A|nr:hypothetical protein [Baekduia alba]WCB93074.1 hypothetical protein DSM104299_01776 [Baekduia alba]
MTAQRAVSALAVALTCALAPAVAHADGWVTVEYKGTLDESFVYQPSDPSVWQATLHFVWAERQVFHLTGTDTVKSEGLHLSIAGRQSSTYAPPNTNQNCSFAIVPRSPFAKGQLSPLNAVWHGTAPIGGSAILPITGSYAMSTGATSMAPSCELPQSGGAGVGDQLPEAVATVYGEAEVAGIEAQLGGPSVTRRFDADGKTPDGRNTASLHATLTLSNSARRPADAGGSPPQSFTPARKQAKLDALDALKDTMQRALYPCGVGVGVGTALIAAGPVGVAVGGTMSALTTPLCLSYLKTIKDEADTVADPPKPGYRTAAKIQPVRAPAAKLPACPASQGAGSPGAVCAQLQPAGQALLRATRATEAAATAIDTTISRETAALKADDRKATALQDRTLRTLGRSFAARRRAEIAAAKGVAQILRGAGLNVTLDPAAAAAALSTLQQRLVAARLPATKLTTALGGAPQVTALDLLTSLGG